VATWHWINQEGEPVWLMIAGRLSGCGGRTLPGHRLTFNTHSGETVAIYDSTFSRVITAGPRDRAAGRLRERRR
jgi:hypothetical protein